MTDINQESINLTPSSPTIHFNIGNFGVPAVAPVPGTPDPDAMSVFGQLNITTQISIQRIHYHQIVDGTAGTSSIEIYRMRDGVFTLIAEIDMPFGGGDFSTRGATPEGNLAILNAGDYIFCQATSIQLGANGATIDVHFELTSLA